MFVRAGLAGVEFSVIFRLMVPSWAVTVSAFATVGRVYMVLASPFVPVMPGLGLNVPPKPSLNEIDVPETRFPTASLAFTTMGLGRVVPTVPVCLLPEIVLSEATGPTTLVSVKIAEAYPVLDPVIVTVFGVFGNVYVVVATPLLPV